LENSKINWNINFFESCISKTTVRILPERTLGFYAEIYDGQSENIALNNEFHIGEKLKFKD
jgi:hypothetical protein